MKPDPREQRLEGRIAKPEAKQQLAQQLQEPEHEAPTVRVSLRLPADLHDEIRKVAKRDGITLNDAFVRRIDEGSGDPRRADEYQQLGDLIQACKLLDENQRPRLKRAIAERINGLYELNIPLNEEGDGQDAELRAQWEAYSKKKEHFRNNTSFDDFAAFKRATPAQRQEALQWRVVTERDIEEARKRLRDEDSRSFAASR